MDLWSLQIPAPMALALVAALGYLIGRKNRAIAEGSLVLQSRRELRRAQRVASDLENIALTVRKSLSRHQASLCRFKDRVSKLTKDQQEAAWKELCREAEEILAPTLRLASQIADAYDQIRQQSAHLMTFTELRTDPLTGVSNRRAMDDALVSQFALMNRYDCPFAMVLVDIDHFKEVNDAQGHLQGDRILQDAAKLIDETVRETDIVARFGGEEFVVIMPQTDLEGACIFADRLRQQVAERLPITISGGVAAALDGDNPETLVARADAAMYSAKQAGRNCIFRHTGVLMEAVLAPPEAVEA